MGINVPRTLQSGNCILTFTGTGKAGVGTFGYFEPSSGHALNLYAGKAFRCSVGFGTTLLLDNQSIPPVVIPTQAAIGSRFLVELSFGREGVAAKRFWRISEPQASRPALTLPAHKKPAPVLVRTGRIVSTDGLGRYIFVETANGGVRFFAHSSQLHNIPMKVGLPVSFKVGMGPKGSPVALDVRAAA